MLSVTDGLHATHAIAVDKGRHSRRVLNGNIGTLCIATAAPADASSMLAAMHRHVCVAAYGDGAAVAVDAAANAGCLVATTGVD